MKKREKKLHLHRETVQRLSPAELSKAHGGALAALEAETETGRWTSCIEPNCCGTVDTQ